MKKIKIIILLGLSLIHNISYAGWQEDMKLTQATVKGDVNAVRALLVLLPLEAPSPSVINRCLSHVDSIHVNIYNEEEIRSALQEALPYYKRIEDKNIREVEERQQAIDDAARKVRESFADDVRNRAGSLFRQFRRDEWGQ